MTPVPQQWENGDEDVAGQEGEGRSEVQVVQTREEQEGYGQRSCRWATNVCFFVQFSPERNGLVPLDSSIDTRDRRSMHK